jgi:hypothetical protein
VKAVVTVTFEPVNDEDGVFQGFKPALEARWMDGSGPRGALSPVQVLAVLESARALILGSVPFEPPTAIAKAPASALKVLDAAGNRPN